jgi:hypothetical protein
LIGDRTNVARVDVTIAGGAYERRTRAGWLVNRPATVWRYRNAGSVTPSPNGVARVRLRRASDGKVRFRITGRNGHYPIDPHGLPLVVTVVLDPPVASTGQCGDVAFPAEAPARPSCSASRDADRVRCR